jgi:hypothetical protein
MPREKDLKRLVRTRMKKTGESYTTARTQLLKKSPTRAATKTAPAPASPVAVTPPTPTKIDYAAVAGMSDDVIREKTGRTWEEWTRTLDNHDAAAMAHRDIAILVSETYKVPAWWTQMLTVGYERIKGLRARGQRRDGTYEAGKSRTFNVPVATLFDAWADAPTRRRWLDETGVKVRTATAPKAMRLGWADGTIVTVWFTPKGKDKSTVAVTHTKLPDKATTNRLKQYWSEKLDALGEMLAKA